MNMINVNKRHTMFAMLKFIITIIIIIVIADLAGSNGKVVIFEMGTGLFIVIKINQMAYSHHSNSQVS